MCLIRGIEQGLREEKRRRRKTRIDEVTVLAETSAKLQKGLTASLPENGKGLTKTSPCPVLETTKLQLMKGPQEEAVNNPPEEV